MDRKIGIETGIITTGQVELLEDDPSTHYSRVLVPGFSASFMHAGHSIRVN